MIHLKWSIVCLTAVILNNKCLAKNSEDGFLGPRHLVQKTSQTTQNVLPDKCRTSFDAASLIRGDLVMFKDKYLWRPAKSDDAMEIRSVWSELPATMSHIDAVYENSDSLVWFFLGHEIYIFDGVKLAQKLSLQDIGIDPKKYSKIDAVFKWPYNQKTYIFSGKDYWKFDETEVDESYPKKIEDTWEDAFEIDAAFSDGKKLFFLKGSWYHEFDSVCMRMDRMTRFKIGLTFLNCVPAPALGKKAPRINDVIRLHPEKCQEARNNIEKLHLNYDDLFE